MDLLCPCLGLLPGTLMTLQGASRFFGLAIGQNFNCPRTCPVGGNCCGADDRVRTGDLNLGKVAL